MKIGILTLHRAVNDGAILQAYCLEQLLQASLPYAKVELIDYRPWRLEKFEYRCLLGRRFPFVNWHRWAKRRTLYAFISQYCALSPTKCITDNLDDAQHFIVKQKYDAIVVGSDIVWQVRRKRSAVPLAPNIYFLPGISGAKKIAFAASADRSDITFLSEEIQRTRLLRSIRDFDFISIRDKAAQGLLLQLGMEEVEFYHMPDPTILWDFSPIIDKPDGLLLSDKRVAGVAVASPSIKAQVTQLMLSRGYQVINLLGPKSKGQISLPVRYSLNQRLGVYPLLDLMVTDRFHGSIFTLKLSDAPVIFVEIAAAYPEGLSKGRDLFYRLGIEEMVWRYEGGKVPGGLLEKYISIWDTLTPDVKAKFELMKKLAHSKIDKIRQVLARGFALS